MEVRKEGKERKEEKIGKSKRGRNQLKSTSEDKLLMIS